MHLQLPCLRRAALLAAALLACGAASAQDRPADPEAELGARARAWLAARHQVAAAAVAVQPLDARVKARPCPAGWQFDQPFPDPAMLRARCADPLWQVFLRVVLPAAAPAPAAVVPAAAPAAPPGPPLVRRGQFVQAATAPVAGLVVSARLEALEDARLGEPVKLKNPESGRVVSGVVTGPNAVQTR